MRRDIALLHVVHNPWRFGSKRLRAFDQARGRRGPVCRDVQRLADAASWEGPPGKTPHIPWNAVCSASLDPVS